MVITIDSNSIIFVIINIIIANDKGINNKITEPLLGSGESSSICKKFFVIVKNPINNIKT